MSAPTSAAASGLVQVQPYLDFNGRCEEAIEFYRKALGAEVVMLMRFKDAPPAPEAGNCVPPPETGNKVMHSTLRVGSTEFFVTDGRCDGKQGFSGISLSLTVANVPAAERVFKALSDGGQVVLPLGKTFFSESFGMVADKFGVMWMVYMVPAAQK